ncbi:MAG TPA: hypothetical protein VGF95_04635 [Solirubrobacteraceae bacterium]
MTTRVSQGVPSDGPAAPAATAGSRRERVLALLALAVIVGCSLFVVIIAANRPNYISATTSPGFFPHWLAGPLGGLWPQFPRGTTTIKDVFTAALVVMYVSYLVGIRHVPKLDPRWAIAAILAVQLIFFLSPPLTQTDVFNYIDYARMEVVHHLNPYTTIPVIEPHSDPAYALSNWHELMSPYGPLFTIIMFAIVPFGVAVSFWLVKGLLAIASLGGLLLVWKCAKLLGRDPVKAIVFAGLNPIVLLWGLGGDHNDFVMVFFLLLAAYLLLRSGAAPPVRREGAPANGAQAGEAPTQEALTQEAPTEEAPKVGRRQLLRGWLLPPAWLELLAGVSLAAAVFVKASGAIVVPVVIAGLARTPRRATQTVLGGIAGTIVFALFSYIAFGAHIPDLGTQGSLVTDLGLPNLLGLALGQGGETNMLREILMLALVLVVVLCCVAAWRSGDFVTHAGWATLGLLVTLAWVLPWYVVWVIPLAALSGSRKLRIATIAFSVYLILAWSPASSGFFETIGFNPESTALGQLHHRYVRELLN